MGTNERVLGDFFRIGAIPKQSQGDGEDFLAVAIHDLDERLFIARVETADELSIVLGFLLRGGGTGRTFAGAAVDLGHGERRRRHGKRVGFGRLDACVALH